MRKPKSRPKAGDLKVWWIPQVPMKSFEVVVNNLEEAQLLMDTLAKYDAFQFENNIKPDYCNAGGVMIYEDDGDGGFEWCDWHSEDGDEFDEYMEKRSK